jgi:DivIVA domain-containing protein
VTVYSAIQPADTERRRPLSAHEIRSFRLATVGVLRRAYAAKEVDDLLDQIAVDTDARNEAITERDAEIARLKQELDDRKHGRLPNALTTGISADVIATQRQVQRYADQMVAEAQNGSAAVMRDARAAHDSVIRAAYARAEQAAQEYRDQLLRDGAPYSADREETERLLGALDLLMDLLDSISGNLGITLGAAKAHIKKVRDGLASPESAYQPDSAVAVGDLAG